MRTVASEDTVCTQRWAYPSGQMLGVGADGDRPRLLPKGASRPQLARHLTD